MSSDQQSVSRPVLDVDGFQWDVSNLNVETTAFRKNVSGMHFSDSRLIRSPIAAVSSVSSYSTEKVSSCEDTWSKHSSNSNEGTMYGPTAIWRMQADADVGEYNVAPTYPHRSEIPACLDVDDIFDKIMVSRSTSKGGGGGLYPSNYRRTPRRNRHSDVSSLWLVPSSPGLDHRQCDGEGSRVGQVLGGMVPQNEQMILVPRLGEQPLLSRRDEDYYHDRNSNDSRNYLERPGRSSVPNTSHDEYRRQYLQQRRRRRVIDNDLPILEVEVPTGNGNRRSRIPEDGYRRGQLHNPYEVLHRGQRHNPYEVQYRGQRHNPYEVHHHHHPPEGLDSSSLSLSSASVLSGIRDDTQSFYREYHRPQQPPLPSSRDDRLVEVTPGTYVKLRGSEETWRAIRTGRTIRTACLSCAVMLLCIVDADMVMCPACRSISPVERDGFGGGGLGLGMAEAEARIELDRLRGSICKQKRI
jgi:hypothetical protein